MKITGYKKGDRFDLEITSIGEGFFLALDAAAAFLRMKAHAKADDLVLIVNSAFRSMAQQKILHRRYTKAYEIWARIDESERAKKPSIVAPPGYSNHQSGTAIDINRGHDQGKTDKWLADNTKDFGFFNTVKSEPWHWEYKDISNA